MRAAAWRVLTVAVIVGAAGCAFTDPVTCSDEVLDPPPTLSCEAAVAAARQQLSAVGGVTALRFEYEICPPNARCIFVNGAMGVVLATLASGEELSVFVSVDPEGIVRAEEPQPIEPSEPTPLP